LIARIPWPRALQDQCSSVGATLLRTARGHEAAWVTQARRTIMEKKSYVKPKAFRLRRAIILGGH
jgi:hypothetical protein